MKLRHLMTVPVLVAGLGLASPAMAGNRDWDTASSIGAYGLTAIALGWPVVEADMQGALQAGGSVVAAQAVTYGLKEIFPETRPDRSDRKSFPSGHTSMAFAAASSLFERQGAEIGIPALAVATFVGVARVQADKHHWYDCVAGAAIGSAAGLIITHKPGARVAVIPWGDARSGGISLAARF